MAVIRDERDEQYPRYSKKVMRFVREIGLERSVAFLDMVYGLDPDFAELFAQYIRVDLYSRDVLPGSTRELCACAALSTLNRQEQLRGHLLNGLALGATKEELLEAIFQSVTYGGFPSTLSSIQTYASVFPEMVKRDRPPIPADAEALPAGPFFGPALENQTRLYGDERARASLDRFNRWDPAFGMAMQRFSYGGLYERTVVSPQVRQLIAVACCTVINALPQVETHARIGLMVGCKRDELKEVIIQMSAYRGFPFMIQAMQVFERMADAWEAERG